MYTNTQNVIQSKCNDGHTKRMRNAHAYYHIIMLYSFSADCNLVSVENFKNKLIQIRIKEILKHKVYNNQLCK